MVNQKIQLEKIVVNNYIPSVTFQMLNIILGIPVINKQTLATQEKNCFETCVREQCKNRFWVKMPHLIMIRTILNVNTKEILTVRCLQLE